LKVFCERVLYAVVQHKKNTASQAILLPVLRRCTKQSNSELTPGVQATGEEDQRERETGQGERETKKGKRRGGGTKKSESGWEGDTRHIKRAKEKEKPKKTDSLYYLA